MRKSHKGCPTVGCCSKQASKVPACKKRLINSTCFLFFFGFLFVVNRQVKKTYLLGMTMLSLKPPIHGTYPDLEARDRQAVCSNGLPQRGQNFQDFHELFFCFDGLAQREMSSPEFPFHESCLIETFCNKAKRHCQDAKTLCIGTETFQHLEFSFLECKLF